MNFDLRLLLLPSVNFGLFECSLRNADQLEPDTAGVFCEGWGSRATWRRGIRPLSQRLLRERHAIGFQPITRGVEILRELPQVVELTKRIGMVAVILFRARLHEDELQGIVLQSQPGRVPREGAALAPQVRLVEG